jgi:hypothetical protein
MPSLLYVSPLGDVPIVIVAILPIVTSDICITHPSAALRSAKALKAGT